LREELVKPVLLFLLLFSTWQVLYVAESLLGLDHAVAYLMVLGSATCFFILDHQKMSDLGLRRSPGWQAEVQAGFILAVALVLLKDAAALATSADPPAILKGILDFSRVAALALTAGAVEEISFRGYILRKLAASNATAGAILLSSTLFAFYNLPIPRITETIALAPALTFSSWLTFALQSFVLGMAQSIFYTKTNGRTVGPWTLNSASVFLSLLVSFRLPPAQANLIGAAATAVVLIPLLRIKRESIR